VTVRRPPPQAVLFASPDDIEAQFYEALQQADLEKLMAVWADDEDVACVLPGGPRLVGHHAIRAGFESVFANGGIPVQGEKVRRVTQPSFAVHHLLVRVEIGPAEAREPAWVAATNVYLKTDQGWRLLAHHASPAMATELPEIGEPAPSVLH
jgi:uncharacterized protein (TIGR02246 family)